jgi:protein-tyrosine phosphatase
MNDRVIHIPGTRNLRDLGGYETEDGRRIKWRRIFRSGALGPLSDDGRASFSALGIRTICDLRTSTEREREPFAFQGLVAGEAYLSWDYDTVYEWRKAFEREPTPSSAREVMFALYEELPNRFADRFRSVFSRLAQDDTPLLFNCSAGKDRTGITAALILLALGVPRQTVIEDYAMSDKVVDFEHEVVRPRLESGESMAAGFAMIASLSPELRAPLLASDPAYLDHALTSIDQRHGSVSAFLENVSHIDADTIAAMRAHLLEPLPERQ